MVQTTYQEIVLDRLNYAKRQQQELKNIKTPGHVKRQNILLYNGDSLGDQDLLNHHRENRMRKIFKFISFFILPGVAFAYRLPYQHIALSLIPAYYLSNFVYSSRIFNRKCDYSSTFADNSRIRHLNNALNVNSQKVIQGKEKWIRSNTMPVKEWIAKHQYR